MAGTKANEGQVERSIKSFGPLGINVIAGVCLIYFSFLKSSFSTEISSSLMTMALVIHNNKKMKDKLDPSMFLHYLRYTCPGIYHHLLLEKACNN